MEMDDLIRSASNRWTLKMDVDIFITNVGASSWRDLTHGCPTFLLRSPSRRDLVSPESEMCFLAHGYVADRHARTQIAAETKESHNWVDSNIAGRVNNLEAVHADTHQF
jgi:hypothetical protein